MMLLLVILQSVMLVGLGVVIWCLVVRNNPNLQPLLAQKLLEISDHIETEARDLPEDVQAIYHKVRLKIIEKL